MASGVVGLVTDFGESPYSGIIRAAARCLGAEPVDLDHSVPSFNVLAGAYVTLAAYKWLPSGSGLAVVVDPGVGGPRRPVLVETRNYYMVGPDNGVLYPAAVDDGVRGVYVLDPARVRGEARARARCPGFGPSWTLSNTFHGRDLFTPAAALASLGVDPERLGSPTDPASLAVVEVEWSEPAPGGGERLRVVYIDKFGNVALSRRGPPPRGAVVEVLSPTGVRVEARAGETFSSVPRGAPVAYENSFGFLEVAVNQGDAARLLGVKTGDLVVVRVKRS